MESLQENILTVLFVGTILAIVGLWILFSFLFRWLPNLLFGKRRAGQKSVPWRFSLGTVLLVTTAVAVVMGLFRTVPLIGGTLAIAIVFLGLCVGRFVQLRHELVRRREEEVRLLLEAARPRERPEAKQTAPHPEN